MEIWTIVSSVLAVAVPAGVTFLVYRKQTPKKGLWWGLEVDPLTPSAPTPLSGKLAVTLDGEPVPDPHLVRLRLWSTGKADIPSSAFDAALPIRFDLTAPVAGSADFPTVAGFDSKALELSGQQVSIKPTLLRRDCAVEVTLVTSGVPEVSERSSIVDVKLRRSPGEKDPVNVRRSRTTVLAVGSLFFYFSIAALVVLFLPAIDLVMAENPSPWFWVLYGLAVVTGLLFYALMLRFAGRIFAATARAEARFLRQLHPDSEDD